MRKARFKSDCLRDLKNLKRRSWNEDAFYAVLGMLMREGRLPARLKPHKLSGPYAGWWECHIENDWLLIYALTETEVVLFRTGTHADLFE